MSDPFIHLYRHFRKRRLFFLLTLTVTLILIGFAASRIRFEEDISRMTGGNNPENLFEYVTTHHQFAEKLIVRFALKDSTLTDPEKLAELATLFSDSLRMRFDSSYIREIRGGIPDSLVIRYMDYFYEHLPLYLDEKDYEQISNRLVADSIDKITQRNYQTLVTPAGFALKKNISRDPLGLTWLAMKKLQTLQSGDEYDLVNGFIFTKDRKNLMLMITPANPPGETSKNAVLVHGIDEISENLPGSGEVSVSSFGAAAMAVGNAEQLKKDIMLTLSVAVFLIIVLLAWYFKSLRIPLLGFLPAVFGGAFALAVMWLFRGTISTIALGIGSVILGLIVDYALYIVTRLRKTNNFELTISDLAPAILLCAMTSMGAFLCLIFLKSAVLHDLGWFAALSVAGAAFFALAFLPQFIPVQENRKQKENILDRFLSRPFERNKILVLIVAIISVSALFFMNRAGFEKDMMALNFTTEKLAAAQHELERISDVSLKKIYVVSTGKDLESALRENERSEDRIAAMKNQGAIVAASGIRELLLSDSLQRIRLERWSDFWTAEKKEILRNSLVSSGKKYGFKETAFTSFFTLTEQEHHPLDENITTELRHLFLNDFIHETGPLIMITSVVSVKDENKEKVHDQIQNDRHRVVFDRQQLTNRFIAGVKADFELLVNLSMIFVTLLLLISFGRIELAILSALPMFAAWGITLGFMGITGIRFNIFNIILSSFIFGLGVDYSILMMRGLLNRYKYGQNDLSSYKVSVFLSGVTTIIGVAVLFMAKHPALKSIALISVAGIIAVMLVTFTLQPFLFNQLIGDRALKGRFPVTFRVFFKTIITWFNIILIAVILMIAGLILTLLPFPKKKKEYTFHFLFSKLSKLYIAVTFPTNRRLINEHGENFRKPAVIIANHQSLIETPAFLRLHPRILILTNDWVWNSPLFGPVARLASFLNASHGLDLIMDKLREKVNEGYSILVFPEAHRSEDGHVQRFHRGAFYLAEKLHLDILPVVVFGSGEFLGKNAIWGRPSPLIMKILKRVSADDTSFGTKWSERTRAFRKLIREEYEYLRITEGSAGYYRKKLILNYVLKGPVLEWYLRVKMKLSGNYEIFNRLVPREGSILDIGCGYGYISYMLMMTSPGRIIRGIDHDCEKIRVAENGFLRNERIMFDCEDVTTCETGKHKAFILSDLLHYISPLQQEKLLRNCIENLEPGGIIIIRDADSSKVRSHKRSRFTEFLSTRVIGFNKTTTEDKTLSFTSSEMISGIAREYALRTEVIEESRHTSNILMVIRK